MLNTIGYPITTITFSGKDRQKWLQGMVTNDIRLTTEQKCVECFVVDVKGRTLAHGWVFEANDALHFVSLGLGNADGLLTHWERYIIREDVEIVNSSSSWQWSFVARKDSFHHIGAMQTETHNASATENTVLISRLDQDASSTTQSLCVVLPNIIIGPEYVLMGQSVLSPDSTESLGISNQNDLLDSESFHRLRIQNLLPLFGVDFDDKNLPQELDRDAKAISFKKGCYLGQETIARLDALGSVQKKLVHLTVESDENPSPGTLAKLLTAGQTLWMADKEIGRITSIAESGQPNRWIAMGYVRRAAFPAGSQLTMVDFDGFKVTVGLNK